MTNKQFNEMKERVCSEVRTSGEANYAYPSINLKDTVQFTAEDLKKIIYMDTNGIIMKEDKKTDDKSYYLAINKNNQAFIGKTGGDPVHAFKCELKYIIKSGLQPEGTNCQDFKIYEFEYEHRLLEFIEKVLYSKGGIYWLNSQRYVIKMLRTHFQNKEYYSGQVVTYELTPNGYVLDWVSI